MEKKTYNIIIIGAGSGGLNVASFFSRINLNVLLIDKEDNNIGGDCLNTGCVPSKAFIHVANQVHEGRLAKRFFTQDTSSIVDIKKVTAYIDSKQNIIRQSENPEYVRNKGIDYMSGTVRFVDKKTIILDGVLYTANVFVLATGSRAKKLSVENDSSLPIYYNETIFSIDFLPKQFVFIGGGPISCELGQAFSRLGSKVTIINSAKRILEKEAEESSSLMEEILTKEGVSIITNADIKKISEKKVFYTKQDSENVHTIDADAVFVGIGRELNIHDLGLDIAGVALNENQSKLLVDEYLRTTNPHLYVVGDVAGNYQFTHAAEMHAKVVINNILSPFKKKFDATTIAWVTYTSPEIATFGISLEKAKKEECVIFSKDLTHDDRAIIDETQEGKLSVTKTHPTWTG
jgi:pyruvate/2-oxoglutarate dehydrogenase complex dihydrolipoamide dehydrogenase (E3) component